MLILKNAIIGCLALAILAAVMYFLTGSDIVKVPTLNPARDLSTIAFVAGGCYVLGGFLILFRKRWLWIVGLVINTLVIAFFFMMYNQKPDIMLSLPGLWTKIAQVLLEFGLIYIIAFYREKTHVARQSA